MTVHRSLTGRRMALFCPGKPEPPLLATLQLLGAEVQQISLIQVGPIPFIEPSPKTVDWLFFTSKNAVQSFYTQATEDWQQIPVATVGPMTADCASQYKISPLYIAPEFEAQRAAEDFSTQYACSGLRILWPCGNLANEQLKTILTQAGAKVSALKVYETQPLAPQPKQLELLQAGLDTLIFTSPSSVYAFGTLAVKNQLPYQHSHIACLGPKTAQAAIDLLGHCHIQAHPYTYTALGTAIQQFYSSKKGNAHVFK